jgi:hypothetical protein
MVSGGHLRGRQFQVAAVLACEWRYAAVSITRFRAGSSF